MEPDLSAERTLGVGSTDYQFSYESLNCGAYNVVDPAEKFKSKSEITQGAIAGDLSPGW